MKDKPTLTAADLMSRSARFTVPIKHTPGMPFRVPVIIKNVRQAYGRTDVLVSPKGGEGEAWTSLAHVELEEPI